MEEEQKNKSFEQLNDELLKPPPQPEGAEPRRNSKEWLIARILQICEEANLEAQKNGKRETPKITG